MYITGEQMMEDDGKLVIGLRGSNRFECAKLVHSRQHRMNIASMWGFSLENGECRNPEYGQCTDRV